MRLFIYLEEDEKIIFSLVREIFSRATMHHVYDDSHFRIVEKVRESRKQCLRFISRKSLKFSIIKEIIKRLPNSEIIEDSKKYLDLFLLLQTNFKLR